MRARLALVLFLSACPRPIPEQDAELRLLKACSERITHLEERARRIEERLDELEAKPLSLTINTERLDGLVSVGKGLGTTPRLEVR